MSVVGVWGATEPPQLWAHGLVIVILGYCSRRWWGAADRRSSIDSGLPEATRSTNWSQIPFLRVVTGRGQRVAERERKQVGAAEMPYVVEALRMCLRSGHSASAAWRAVGYSSGGHLAHAMVEADAWARRTGSSITEAWVRLEDADPVWRSTVSVLRDSHRLGSASDVALAAVADEARRSVTAQQRARIQALSIKLLFPLLLCILPAFVCLAILPSLAGLADGASFDISGR